MELKFTSGVLEKHTPEEAWPWAATQESPQEGDSIIYWRCGSDNSRSFTVPPIGGTVCLSNCRRLGDSFALGEVRFVRGEFASFTEQTPVGDSPASWGDYRRVA